MKYYSQRNAWMDSDIFKKWFQDEFVPSVRRHLKERGLEPKTLLLLDNVLMQMIRRSLPCSYQQTLLLYNSAYGPGCTGISQASIQKIIAEKVAGS